MTRPHSRRNRARPSPPSRFPRPWPDPPVEAPRAAAGPPGSRSADPAAARWRIALTAEARRGLHRLPGRVAAAIDAFLTGPLAADPAAVSVPLRNELAAYRSARRGDYRVLVRLDERARTVLAVRVGHRADAYRPKRNQ